MRNMKHNARKVLAFVLIAMQLFAIAAIGVQAEDIVISKMTVNKTEAATMNLDGQVTTGEAWDTVEWSSTSHTLGATPLPADCGMNFKALWTKNDSGAALWFLIDMRDPQLDATGRAWNQDNVRVYIDEDGISADNVKVAINQADYGTKYVSSEFMSYANNTMSSKGFEYKVTKKAGDIGYIVEVKYTFQNADLAVAGAKVRANVATVFANGGVIQTIWSRDSKKWSENGLNDKDYFANAGELTLSDTVASVPLTSSRSVQQAAANDMVLDGANSQSEAWDLVEWSTEGRLLGGTPLPADCGMRFKSLWTKSQDGAALWFLIDMKDSTLDATSRAWNTDNVRVFIDEDGVNADNAKIVSNNAEYGNQYASSEFMSYVTHSFSSKGFEYKVTKKADNSGYIVEVKYTFQNAALAVPGAKVRANLATIFTNASNSGAPIGTVWSFDSVKWSGGLNNKDYFAHAGTLTLLEDTVKITDVPARVIGCQETAVYTNASEKSVCDVRFVGLINALSYDAAGYKLEVAYQGKTATYTQAITEVYSSLKAGDEILVAPDGTYYLAMKVTNVPADATVTFTVTPYTQAAGEAVVEGAPFVVTYSNGTVQY